MATWQFTLHLIPRTTLALLFPAGIPDSLDPEIFDSTEWWKGPLCQDYESEISSFMKEGKSWTESIRMWGEEDSDRLNLIFDNGHIAEVEVRIDVGELDLRFVENICSFAKLCDCLLLTEEFALIEPDVELLRHQIGKSNAWGFVSDPAEFLNNLGRGDPGRARNDDNDSKGGLVNSRNVVLITIALWLAVTSCYGYYWVTSILAQPDNYGYEQWVMFPLLGFIVYRFPFLVVGLIVLISGELLLCSRSGER